MLRRHGEPSATVTNERTASITWSARQQVATALLQLRVTALNSAISLGFVIRVYNMALCAVFCGVRSVHTVPRSSTSHGTVQLLRHGCA